MNERRRTRVVTGKEVALSWGEHRLDGVLRDVSLKGAYVRPEPGEAPPLGAGVTLTIRLEPGDPDLDVEVRARVVRTEPGGLALDFVEVPAEGFPHLLRLVQYNAPDPGEIEQEVTRPAFEPPEE